MAGRGKKPTTAAPTTGRAATRAAARAAEGAAAPDRATPTRTAEIETKLEIGPDATLPELTGRKALATAGLARSAEPATYELDATYYDTAELDLLRSKMTLRRRTGGVDAGWHLKLPAVADARTEVGLPLSSGDAGQVPAELGDLVRGAARGRPLMPVARLQNRRTVRHLLDAGGDTMVEVADDHVTATPLLDGGAAPSAWRELEVEIVDGSREQLAATVDVLRGAGATPASSASKLARALSISSTAPAAATGAAARRAKSAGAVVLVALGRLRDRLITADRGLRDDAEEALHDLTVVVRRLRAVLTVDAPLFDGTRARDLRAGLRDLGHTATAAHDVQVARARLLAHLSDEPDEYAGPARDRLADAFDRRLDAARTDLRTRLDSEDYLQLLRDLDGLIDDPPLSRRAERPVAAELATLIGAAWQRLRGRADTALADPGNTPAVHAVRRSARTIRYATEAAIAVLGDDAVVFAAAIEDIQVALGEVRDAGIAAALLIEFAHEDGTDGVAGFTFGRLHAFEQAMAHGAFDEFADAWDRVEDGDLVAALVR